MFLVASHFAEQLNERKLNKAKRREGRLIVASRLRIGDIFQCCFLVASRFAVQLNEYRNKRKLNKAKHREGRLIVASPLRIEVLFLLLRTATPSTIGKSLLSLRSVSTLMPHVNQALFVCTQTT